MQASILKLFNRPQPVHGTPPAEALSEAQALILATSNPEARDLAARCRNAEQALANKKTARHFIRRAAAKSAEANSSVPAVLQIELERLQSEYRLCESEDATDTEALRKHSQQEMPLWIAVGRLTCQLETEAPRLSEFLRRVDEIRHGNALHLLKTGLTMQDIEQFGKLDPSNATVEDWKQRLAVNQEQLAKISAFQKDPLHRHFHLAGLPLPGFHFPSIEEKNLNGQEVRA